MTWDLDAAGNITLCPLTGYDIATAMETAIMTRIEFARTPDQLESKREALQVVLTPKQALQLSEDLRRAAEHILALPRPDRTN